MKNVQNVKKKFNKFNEEGFDGTTTNVHQRAVDRFRI